MNLIIFKNLKSGKQKGYTLLFAVLTASLVLGVAVFILGVSKKQFALSVAARDSMYSIYAADSGIECATAKAIATGTPETPIDLEIKCNDSEVSGSFVPIDGSPYGLDAEDDSGDEIQAYQAAGLLIPLGDINSDNDACAMITVTDGYYLDGTVTKHKTIIDSQGYNYCSDTGPAASTRTVERALRMTYSD